MKIDANTLIQYCEEAQKNANTLKAFIPEFTNALSHAGDDLVEAHFYPETPGIIAHVKTREAFAPIRALHKGAWDKRQWPCEPGDMPKLSYKAEINGVRVTVNVSQIPPSCRIETDEVYVPAHNEIRRKIVCNGPKVDLTEAAA